MMVNRIRVLRSDLTQAYNPYSLQKILDGTLELFQYLLTGSTQAAHPNQVPGSPINPLDTGKARVEFFSGPPQNPPPPQQPINAGGDVRFIPGPPPGQTVGGMQDVEFFGGPPQAQIPVQRYERNGQTVEFFSTTPPPSQPLPGAVNNPPTASFIPGAPPVNVEAGQPIPGASSPYAPAQGLPAAPAFADAAMRPPSQQQPQSREDILASLAIPVAGAR
jgi:hypothetical protein